VLSVVVTGLFFLVFSVAAWAVVTDVNFTPKENAKAIPGAKVTIEVSEPKQKTDTAEKKSGTAEPKTAAPAGKPPRRVQVTASSTGEVRTKVDVPPGQTFRVLVERDGRQWRSGAVTLSQLMSGGDIPVTLVAGSPGSTRTAQSAPASSGTRSRTADAGAISGGGRSSSTALGGYPLFPFGKYPVLPFGKSPVSAIVPTWSGLYLGGALGAVWSYAKWTSTDIWTLGVRDPLVDAIKDMVASNIAETVYIGYMFYGAPEWLAGFAAEFAYYNVFMDPGIPGTGAAIILGDRSADSASVRANWAFSLLARLGYLVTPTTQVYGIGGVSWLNMDAAINCTGPGVCGSNGITPFSQTNSATKAGYTIGGGIETILSGNWRGKMEYRYSDYGKFSTDFGNRAGLALAADIDVHTHTLMFGLIYGFGGPPPPAR